MQFNATKCDVCGKIKGETNHWLRVWVTGTVVAITGYETETCPLATDASQFDVCGQDCAVRKASEFMGGMQ
jgi:hypothetical protein